MACLNPISGSLLIMANLFIVFHNKHEFSQGIFEEDFIEERRAGLEGLINRHHHHHHNHHHLFIIITRPKPAFGRQGLAGGIMEPWYRSSGYEPTRNQENRPGTMNNHKDQPGAMNIHKKPPWIPQNQPGTMKNWPGTIKNTKIKLEPWKTSP